MNINSRTLICLAIIFAFAVQAQLTVTVSPPKMVGQKAVVKLAMKNNLPEKVESARAVCFLLDDQGKMIGQTTKWVVGGTKDQRVLEPKSETTFNFVITSPQPYISTNLTAKVSFTRVVLEGDKLANVAKDVNITPATQ